jgi:glycine/D-amino acid oxidase-like deaminating enzyme
VSGCRTFWSEDLLKEAEEAIKHLKEAAPDIGNMVTIITDKTELQKHRVHPSCTGATLTEGAGSLWPYKYVTFILENLVKQGILNLQTTTPVTTIASTPSTFASNNAPPKTLYTLSTPRGPISTTTLLLATNGYTSCLLPSFADLIVPVRGTMSALIPPPNSTLLPDSYGMVGALDQPKTADDYLIQRPFSGVPNPAGHLMFGGGRGSSSLPCIGVSDDSELDTGAAAYLRTALPQVLDLTPECKPGDELEATAQWTGIMGYSRDDHPWVGAVPDMPGVWLAGGYTGHGMPNGMLCGKAIVGMGLAALEGEDVGRLEEEMVERGDIPRSYLISRERIERSRKLQTVEVQDREGGFRV